MLQPSICEVERLAARGNLAPVWCELPADLDTPVSIFLKLRQAFPASEAFLLESVEGGEQVARYSFIGAAPAQTLTVHSGRVTVRNGHQTNLPVPTGNPLDVLRELMRGYQAVPMPGLPRFTGGLVGYLAYDIARCFEELPATAHDDLQIPDAIFMLVDTLIAFDHVKHRLMVISHVRLDGDIPAAYRLADERVDQLSQTLRKPLAGAPAGVPARGPLARSAGDALRSNMTPEQYRAMVVAAKEYIAAGDAFQVVLSQRFERETSAAPFDIYRALRRLNPSPYMFFIDLGHLQLIGASPEMMVRLEDGVAEVRPIAGTRRRGASDAEDQRLAQELLSDPKEGAEHVMLVDLGRNDLGRVAEFGSVNVAELMGIEKFSHVMHIVSRVRARLRPEFDAFDLFRATFPAGTLSGAPKIRAMEIIEELERTKRGAYGGAVGYFDYAGNMDTCITIRTILMRGQRVYIQAGAGIVADSDPAAEHQECVDKAKALAEAIRQAEVR
jgi:anthranilate synthase component I